MSTALAATAHALHARTPGSGTPGQAPGDAGALFALLLGGILPITPGNSSGQPPAGPVGQVAAPAPRPPSPPLTTFVEAPSEPGPSNTAEPAQAEPSPHGVPAWMQPPASEQSPPPVTAPHTTVGVPTQAMAEPALESSTSLLPPAPPAGPSATAAPLDADRRTLPAAETAPQTRPGIGRLSLPAAAPEGTPQAAEGSAVSTAAPHATPGGRPSAPASGRSEPVAQPIGPSAPAADPAVGRGDPDRSQPPDQRPASVQLRAQAPTWATGLQLDRVGQSVDHPAGDGRAVASVDGADLGAGRADRGALDLPAPPARTAVATPALQIAHQIVRAAHQRIERMVVQLEPAELGRVEIRLDFGHDGRMSALIATDRADALDLLQREARALERSLEQAGLRLDSGGLSFALKRDGGQGHASSGASELPGDPSSSTGGSEQEPPTGLPAIVSLRLLDLQV